MFHRIIHLRIYKDLLHYIIYIFYIYGLYNPGLYNFRRHVYIFIDVLYYVFLYLRFFTVLVYTTLDTLCAFYRVGMR